MIGLLQRVREALVQVRDDTDDADTGQELAEFNRRVGELREGGGQRLRRGVNDNGGSPSAAAGLCKLERMRAWRLRKRQGHTRA